MSMGFKDILASDVQYVFTNNDEFGEQVVYVPNGGTPRTIDAVVDEDGDFEDATYSRDEVEVLEVFVSRDSTTGIDDPQLGDRIRRSIDPSWKWYAYSGQKMDVDETAWTLRFTRRVADQHGGLPSQ